MYIISSYDTHMISYVYMIYIYMYVYVFFYIYVVAFQLFSDTVLGPNACCEQPPGVPHPPMYQYRPRVYISNTLCAKKWATDPNITWKSNMHPLPKNLTLKSLNQMKEREREIKESHKAFNISISIFHGCSQEGARKRNSSRDRRGAAKAAAAAATVASARRKSAPPAETGGRGVMLWGAGRGIKIIMVLWDNHEGFIMSVWNQA